MNQMQQKQQNGFPFVMLYQTDQTDSTTICSAMTVILQLHPIDKLFQTSLHRLLAGSTGSERTKTTIVETFLRGVGMGRVWRWDGVVESWERNAEMQTQRLKRSLFNMRELMLLDLLK
jgi:hypothetical protein